MKAKSKLSDASGDEIVDWNALSVELEALKAKPSFPSEASGRMDALIAEAKKKQLAKFVRAYFELLRVFGDYPSIIMREQALFVRALDPAGLDKLAIHERLPVDALIDRLGGNTRLREAAERWAARAHRTLYSAFCTFQNLRSRHVRDYRSALVHLIADLTDPKAAGRKTPVHVPAELMHLARMMRDGNVAMSVTDPLDMISLAWRVSAFDVPDELTEPEALEFLRAAYGRRVGGTKLGECAKRNPALKAGDKFVRSELEAAEQNGEFERQKKSRAKP